jgi:hypothetical protein
MAALDRRAVRPLTSREIAKVLGGFLGGVHAVNRLAADETSPYAGAVVTVEQMRTTLRLSLAMLTGTAPPDAPELRRGTALVHLSGLVGGLCTWCSTASMIEALTWWIDHPSALESLFGDLSAPKEIP